eukprot:5797450-Ditylum_brightwellii.AAC.1
MVQLNLMPNCPITTQDIKNAKITFSKDAGALKGKTTRKPPLPVVTAGYLPHLSAPTNSTRPMQSLHRP